MPKTSSVKSKKPVEVKVESNPAPAQDESPKRDLGPIINPKLEIFEYSTTVEDGEPTGPYPGRGPMTPDDWKALLGWETESEYQKRKMDEATAVMDIMNSKIPPKQWAPTVAVKLQVTDDVAQKMVADIGAMMALKKEIKPDNFKFKDSEVHCMTRGKWVEDEKGKRVIKKERVRCHHNANNRPFDDGWSEDIMNMVLVGQWAGPHTVPGETVNGETVRVGRYGHMLSGQHQGTGCIWADEELALSRTTQNYDPEFPKYPFWNGHDHVFIETIVILGVSEDERVLRTIDYVKPRTVADMLFTMPLYKDNNPVERKELTRMLSSAIDLLWYRTNAQGYKTHPEVVGFLERHGRLLDCVAHLFSENNATGTNEFECKKCKIRSDTKSSDQPCLPGQEHDFFARNSRRISALDLNAGQCSALCFLQGCSGTPLTESDDYRNMMPPSEKPLNWSQWDRAKQFWVDLAGSRSLLPVRTALKRLTISKPGNEENQGLGGRADEKIAVLSLAWGIYKDHPLGDPENPPFNDDDLEDGASLDLQYSRLGPPRILNGATVAGEELPDGQVRLISDADFLGIDYPMGNKKSKVNTNDSPLPPTTSDPTPEKIIEMGREMQDQKADKKNGKSKAESAPSKLDELAAQAERNKGNVKVPVKPRTTFRKK